jgi:hypothetical protein
MKAPVFLIKCSLCAGGGWVCSLHRGRPWDGPDACTCGTAGVACPQCNVVQNDKLPRMPKGFKAKGSSDEPFVLQR